MPWSGKNRLSGKDGVGMKIKSKFVVGSATAIYFAAFFCGMGAGRCETASISKEFNAYMVQNHYVAVPLDQDERAINAQTVSAEMNGRKLTLLVDTGTSRTLLSAATARRMKLDVQDTGKSDWGVGGQIQGNIGIALIQSFTLGQFPINRTNTVEVFPKSAHNIGFTDGVLGLDVMRLNAVIYPVGGTAFLLKPGGTPSVSIASYMQRLGFTPLALTAREGSLMIDGHINDHPMQAKIDSGACFSTFDSTFVRNAVGYDVPALPMDLEGFDGNAQESCRFRPKKFDLEGFDIPPFEIVSARVPSFLRGGFTGLLGVDVLGTHRAVVDFGNDILWMK
jgi:hypothetical protein